MCKSLWHTWLIFLGVVAFLPTSEAVTLYVDFSETSGSPGGNWNLIPNSVINSTVSGLVDFNTGTATVVDLELSGFAGTGGAEPIWAADKNWVLEVAGDDYFSVDCCGNMGTAFFDFLPGTSYTVEVVSAFDGFGPTDIQVNGLFADRTFEGGSNLGDEFWPRDDGSLPADWLIWDDVTPMFLNGGIALDLFGGPDNLAFLNAVRITENTPIPEPRAVGLFLGLSVLLAVRLFRKP